MITVIDASRRVLGKGEAARHRPDLREVGGGRTDLGFRIPLPDLEQATTLHVLADGTELPASPVALGPGLFDGAFAVADGMVEGWVVERVPNFSAPTIHILDQDGDVVGEGRSMLEESGDPLFRAARFAFPLAQRAYGRSDVYLRALAGTVEFAHRYASLRLVGYLDLISSQHCRGWLLSPDAPSQVFDVEVFRDSRRVGAGRCDLPRDDLRPFHPKSWRAGFDFPLRGPELAPAETTTLSIRLTGSEIDLFDGPFMLGDRTAAIGALRRAVRLAHRGTIDGPERSLLTAAAAAYIAQQRQAETSVLARHTGSGLRPGGPRLSVIIPVYRGVELTRACILSVLAHRCAETDRIVLVNDCSPDAGMPAMLDAFAREPNVFLLTNPENRGFVQSVNRALEFCRLGDVVLLNSDTRLFAGALDELWRIAHDAPEIATATALSNNATIFSYPHPLQRSARLADASWEELAAVALRENAGHAVDVPTGHGFCMLIRREALRQVGALDESFGRGYGEENDFCLRTADLGFRHVAASGVLVEHRESTSFEGAKAELLAHNLALIDARYPEYMPTIAAFERTDPLRSARWALDAARLAVASREGRGFALVIGNALGGGTGKAIRDQQTLGVYGGATRLSLFCRPDGYVELTGKAPPLHAVFAPDEAEPALHVLAAARIDAVWVHQLLGFSAEFVTQLAAWAKRQSVVYHVHDYYALCPRVTMIDASGRFCDVADTDVCRRCLALGGSHEASQLDVLTPAEHRAVFRELLAACQVIAPSQSAADYLRRGFPGLTVEVAPHPEHNRQFPPAPRAGSDEEVVLFGALGPHKGSATLLEIATRAKLTHPHLRFRVIGYTDIDRELRALGNVSVSGPYKEEELTDLAGRAQGRLALFLHGWPETYSYALSEAVEFGFIPLVPDIGAPAERVRAAGFGVVFPFPIDAAQVLGLIGDIATGRQRVWAEGATPERLRGIRTDRGGTFQPQ